MTSKRRRAALALAVVLAAGAAGGCAGGGDDASPGVTSGFTVPSGTGDRCSDPTGDLDVPAGVDSALPGLSGIDLTEASTSVEGDQLAVSFTVAGSIDEAPDPTYVVAQGDPLQPLSFELRLVRDSSGWSTTLITWPSGVERRRNLALTPQVDGSTVSVSIPLDQLPPIAQVMQFGATARPTADAIAIDDCSSLSGG